MESIKKTREVLSGKGREEMPNLAFRSMTAVMKMIDFFSNYSGKNIKILNLKPGQTVIDYGCGPARYIRNASKIVGETGKVIATDIHPLAIKKVKEKIEKYKLSNVEAVLATGYQTGITSACADVVYALDMFHMIEQPNELLIELVRLAKTDGRIIIEDGHQPRGETKKKIENSRVLNIVGETKSYVECKKVIS